MFACLISLPFFTCLFPEHLGIFNSETQETKLGVMEQKDVSHKAEGTFILGRSVSFSPKKFKLSACFSVTMLG